MRWEGRAHLSRWFRRSEEEVDPKDRRWVVSGRFGEERLGRNVGRRWKREAGRLDEGSAGNEGPIFNQIQKMST